MGDGTIASGRASTAMGSYATAPSSDETVIGRYNTDYTPTSTNSWSAKDRLFVVGNGTENASRSNALTILKNGNMGIGADNPGGNRLRVVSNTSGANNATGNFTNENASGLALRASTHSSDGTALLIQEGPGYSMRCDGYDPNFFVAMIVKGRQVGINTSAPTQNLDVNGNARIRSIGSGAYAGVVNRMADGTLTTATSDARLKTNMQPLQNSLGKIMQLQGVSFLWKDDLQMGQRIGFVAQDFEKVLPELSFTNPADGYMGIHYAELTAVLAEAIKELKAENDTLKARLETVEKILGTKK
jgi:hypothetical protein